jgi:prefoldin subunit 1
VFAEVEQKFYQTQQELQQVRTQIASRRREIKLHEATERELKSSDDNATVWEGVGKMFLSTELDNYLKVIEKDKKELQDSITALDKKQHYLEMTQKNVTDAINEMTTARR